MPRTVSAAVANAAMVRAPSVAVTRPNGGPRNPRDLTLIAIGGKRRHPRRPDVGPPTLGIGRVVVPPLARRVSARVGMLAIRSRATIALDNRHARPLDTRLDGPPILHR